MLSASLNKTFSLFFSFSTVLTLLTMKMNMLNKAFMFCFSINGHVMMLLSLSWITVSISKTLMSELKWKEGNVLFNDALKTF